MTRAANEPSLERWRGRVALVTGASSGIGRAVAELLLRAGMKVAGCARRVERVEALAPLAQTARRAGGETAGGELLACAADLRKEGDIQALFEAIRREWGGVDVLVNNAGLGRAAPLVSGATEAWREMLEVNVLALCICTREALRDMRERGDDGHVIHLSSLAGHRVPPGAGVYAASKFAVRALTDGLRQELRRLGSGVRVTSISPGLVETEFAAVYHGSEQAAREIGPRFKVLESGDVAEAVRWALAAPPHVEVHDILMRPREQQN